MGRRHRPEIVGIALVAAACVLAACGDAPAPLPAARTSTSTTTTTTSAPPPTSAVEQGVAVPNVVGMKIVPARFYLRAAGFATVPLNPACNKGTLASQSVVASLSVPGKPPDVRLGALPLVPGSHLPKGARVGITWSDCYPSGTAVPLVTGQTFTVAVHLLHLAGLNWACYSVGTTTTLPHPTTTRPTTATTAKPSETTSSTADPTSSTSATTSTTTLPPTTTTTPPASTNRVLSQGVKAGTTVRAGSVVTLVMHRCPQ